MSQADYESELERRLLLIEHPDYEDPARHDLPRIDFVLLIVGSAVVIALAWIWGYPA